MVDGYTQRRQGEKRYVPAKVTFGLTDVMSACVCTLEDASDAVAGGVSGVTCSFANSAGGVLTDTVWTVKYLLDLTSGGIVIANGLYTLKFTATDAAGETYCPEIGIKVTD